MPMLDTSPRFSWLCGVDVTDTAGVVAYKRGPNVTQSSQVYFGSLLALFNSYGSQSGRDLANDFRDQWIVLFGGAPAVNFSINTSDQIYVDCDAGPFSLKADADNAFWGADPAGQSSVVVGATNRITFSTSNWSRDQPTNKHLTFNVGATTWSVPSVPYRAQGIPTLLRKVNTVGDLDDVDGLTCLETLDNTAADAGQRRYRWGIDAEGYVWTAYPAGLAAPTWQAAGESLRTMLGFTGDEVAVAVAGLLGNVNVVTATHWPTRACTPTRSLARLRERFEEHTRGHRTRGGALRSAVHLPRKGWEAHFYVDGPSELSRLHRHFFDRFLPNCFQGERVEAVIGWPGETRRAADPRDQDYGISYTVEGYHDRGRVLGRRALDDARGRVAAWPQDGATSRRTRLPVKLRIDALEDGV